MFSERILRESENVSSVRNSSKSLESRKKGVLGCKTNALGDVRNTLHSRSVVGNLSAKEINTKSNSFVKKENNENVSYSCKKENKVKSSSICKNNKLKYDLPDIHNHNMCEQADEACVNNFFIDGKLNEETINHIVKLIKPAKISLPLKTITCEPCDDLTFHFNKIWEDENESQLDDLYSDIKLPEIQPPNEFY